MFKLAARGEGWGFLFSWPFVAALALYGVTTILWVFVLRAWPLSVAYPTQALAIVVVLVTAHFASGESLTLAQLAGFGAIVLGVMLLAF